MRPAAARSRPRSHRLPWSARRCGCGSAPWRRWHRSPASASRKPSGGTARSECGARPRRAPCASHSGFRRSQQAQHRVGRADEAALAFVRRQSAEAAGLVEHRQQREADAGALRGAQQRERQRGIVGVGTAVGVVVQVVEFADRGVAGFEHLDVQAGGDRFELLRDEPRGEAVHQRAPAPEAVLRLAAEFGQAGEGALEGMRVQVRHAGDAPGRAATGVPASARAASGVTADSIAGLRPTPAARSSPSRAGSSASARKGRASACPAQRGDSIGDPPLPHHRAHRPLPEPVGQLGRVLQRSTARSWPACRPRSRHACPAGPARAPHAW